MTDDPTPFLPITAEGWSAIAANAAVVVSAVYAGFNALPKLSTALRSLARRDLVSAAGAAESAVRTESASAGVGSDLDALKERRVSSTFALFEHWKSQQMALLGGIGAVEIDGFPAGYRIFVQRMLGYFDLMLADLPSDRAEHWKQVLLGELVRHVTILDVEFHKGALGGLKSYSDDLKSLVKEAVAIA